jgi:hypothetical protein
MDWSNLRLATLIAASLCLSGCAALVSKAANGFSDNLSSAFLNQDDPETVRAGMPSYMLLIDSFVQGEKPSPAMLSAAANLYASYGAVFTDDEVRASRLTRRARGYSSEAMCLSYADACAWDSKTYDEFVASLAGVGEKQADLLYIYAFTMLAYIRAHTSDWNALAELPQAEATLNRYLELSGSSAKASAEEARNHFERAIAMSDGRDLSAKVEFAKGYAKSLYERELHDQLVTDVLTASPYADGLTLMNVLAQEEAATLLAQAEDYF